MRLVFAGAWLAVQAGLVLTADTRADRVFGFRMFNEASTVRVRLSRVLGDADVLESVEDGVWEAHDCQGEPHEIRWDDRVFDARFATWDETMHASYGVDAHLARLQAALDDVAAHIPRDCETRQLVADVRVRRNGHAAYSVQLRSTRRW